VKRAKAAGQAGFTLIELLIVIAILGVLAAIAVQAYSVYRASAYDTRAMHDLANAVSAEEAYYATSGKYVAVDVAPSNTAQSIDEPGFIVSATVGLKIDADDEKFDGTSSSTKGSGKVFGYDSITDTFVNN
jgi:prepilin-type N-terminal cleavage/methylation domain-containing protein